ncbi:MAG: lipocalin-like domain-containing protein [Candidatus Acidiferrales bacterium]
MRNSIAFLVAIMLAPLMEFQAPVRQFRNAAPGYKYEFPRDYFNHADYQTEWWYYTGNLTANDGRAYGFELTFFRVGVKREKTPPSDWAVNAIYMAHLALSDIDGGRFYHCERLNRAGAGIAGVSEDSGRIWDGNWKIQFDGGAQDLDAISDEFSLHFELQSQKPPVIHGVDGVSQKSAAAGHGSHYISLTRLGVKGAINLAGTPVPVTGVAWMDHEFFTEQLDENQIGWDWLSVQLDDDTELMIYRIRRRDGSIDPYSSGTYIDASGKATHLPLSEFEFVPSGETWTSPKSKAKYPIHWKVSVRPLHLDLDVATPLPSQEIVSVSPIIPSYWEGAVRFSGDRSGAPIKGVGYLEMTGYDMRFHVTAQTSR